METGKVVRLIRDRGFGFIRIEDGSEVFFHHSSMNPGEFDALQEGEDVEFSIEQDPRGRGSRASNVRRMGTTSPAGPA